MLCSKIHEVLSFFVFSPQEPVVWGISKKKPTMYKKKPVFLSQKTPQLSKKTADYVPSPQPKNPRFCTEPNFNKKKPDAKKSISSQRNPQPYRKKNPHPKTITNRKSQFLPKKTQYQKGPHSTKKNPILPKTPQPKKSCKNPILTKKVQPNTQKLPQFLPNPKPPVSYEKKPQTLLQNTTHAFRQPRKTPNKDP